MVVIGIAVAFVLLVASPALVAFLPEKRVEVESRPSGRACKVLAMSRMQRG